MAAIAGSPEAPARTLLTVRNGCSNPTCFAPSAVEAARQLQIENDPPQERPKAENPGKPKLSHFLPRALGLGTRKGLYLLENKRQQKKNLNIPVDGPHQIQAQSEIFS